MDLQIYFELPVKLRENDICKENFQIEFFPFELLYHEVGTKLRVERFLAGV